MEKYKGSIIGFIGGTTYILFFAYLFSIGESYSIEFLEFVSIAMLIVSPVSIGIFTVLFLTKEQIHTKSNIWLHPWFPILAWAIISLLLVWETIICVIMLLPLFLPMASIGGFIGGYIRRKYIDRPQSGILSCLAIFPLFVGVIETPFESPTEYVSVTDTVVINAAPDAVWKSIPNIKNIDVAELPWNMSHFMGIPKPVSALTPELKVGGIRELYWERGVHFQEEITELTVNKKLGYRVLVDQESMKIAELDTHIVVGDKYFDVISGEYELTTEGGVTFLSLTSKYRITSKVNWYGVFWANFVLDDFHNSVLTLIKNRVEQET